jgi:hypothetical protein
MSAYREPFPRPEPVRVTRRWVPDPIAITVAIVAGMVGLGACLSGGAVRCEISSLGTDRVQLFVCRPE